MTAALDRFARFHAIASVAPTVPTIDGAALRAELLALGRITEGGTLERIPFRTGVPLDAIGIRSAARDIYKTLRGPLDDLLLHADPRVAAAIEALVRADRLAIERRKKFTQPRAAEESKRP